MYLSFCKVMISEAVLLHRLSHKALLRPPCLCQDQVATIARSPQMIAVAMGGPHPHHFHFQMHDWYYPHSPLEFES